ncbi:MAG: hypothetical protein ACP5N7_04305 [Candidatus Pacearchaeota archaeon]
MRAPKVDCKSCWEKYFSTDTDKKKGKYPSEYTQYIEPKIEIKVTPKPVEEPKIVEPVVKPEVQTDVDYDDFEKISIPMKLNTYYWSEELQTTVKLTSVKREGAFATFHVDLVKVVPIKKIKDLKLIPIDRGFFYAVKSSFPVKEFKMDVYVPTALKDRLMPDSSILKFSSTTTDLSSDLPDMPSALPIEESEDNLMEYADSELPKKRARRKK